MPLRANASWSFLFWPCSSPASAIAPLEGYRRHIHHRFVRMLDRDSARLGVNRDATNNPAMARAKTKEPPKSVQRRDGRSEHRARLVAVAILKIDHRAIRPFAYHALDRNRPTPRAAVPVADLHHVADDGVIDDLTAAVFAPADRDRY